MKIFYGVLAGVAVIGVGAILYAAQSGGASVATEPVSLESLSDGRELLQRGRGIPLGKEGAPVEMLLFSDFQCPGCAAWAGQVEPLLKSEFIETGKLRVIYYDFPLGGLHQYAFVAARAARCAEDQQQFWPYHDRLFATQTQWSFSERVPVDHFVGLAREIGLDPRAFEACLRSDQHAELVSANHMVGEALRVRGTPSVFINGKQLEDWKNYDDIRNAVIAAGGS